MRLNPAKGMMTVAGVLLAALLAGCGPEPAPEPGDAAALAAFASAEEVWRAQRRERLLAPDGWTSLIGLHWIQPGDHFVGSAPGNGMRIAMGPPELGRLALKDGVVRFFPSAGAGATVDGEPANAPVVLRSDADPEGPSVIGFGDGDGKATVIERHGRLALRVRHALAPTRVNFAGLDYWPAAKEWQVEGRFVAHPPGRTIEIADIIGGTEPLPNPGAIEFTRDGRTYRIEAIDEGDTLFLVFADRTNGHGSYPAGRFMDVPQPDADGRVLLDFNRAYNPPCAFTAFATCPLPPPENRLDLAIPAGEKAYAKSPHA